MGFSFILLAGGNSDRFKSNLSKPYQKIGGKTLIDISIDKIKKFSEIDKIVLVYNREHKKHLKRLNLEKITLISGGNSRCKSTYNALRYLKTQKNITKVLIHDAARPNFSKRLIKKILTHSRNNKTVIPILRLQDALKEKKTKKNVVSLDRSNFFITQTPQCFNLSEIYHLHKENKNNYKDDDFSLLHSLENIKFVNGEKRNFKITDKEDFDLLKNSYRSSLRTGIGFDVHRLIKGRDLFLGGLKIPSIYGTLGHSDGDPILHAIIDAVLGACGMGDIGEMFSDKNKKFKNIRSDILIRKVVQKIKIKNFLINNIDINVITEKPKLKNLKKKIINNISNLCKLPADRINLKAKTTEKLGVIGHEKAIASEVIVTVVKYD